MYVSEKMKRGTGSRDKAVKLPQSSDISAPYILACNYADASPKVVCHQVNFLWVIIMDIDFNGTEWNSNASELRIGSSRRCEECSSSPLNPSWHRASRHPT
jgi:hypothetical protein